jgi:hypothetical protein
MTHNYLLVSINYIHLASLDSFNIHNIYDIFLPFKANKNLVTINYFFLYNYFQYIFIFIINNIETIFPFIRAVRKYWHKDCFYKIFIIFKHSEQGKE